MDFIRIFLSENVVSMEYEIVLMAFLLLCAAFLIREERSLIIAWGLISLFFIYIHRALLPMIVSGIWCGILFFPLVRLIPGRLSRLKAKPYIALIILILLIQISRVNIAIDYDSIRYGLRSDVLLSDSGIAGFFKSMGLVNTVYTYPKGYEVLILPLLLITGGKSFGPALCFNIWILLLVIMVSGMAAEEILGGSDGERGYAGALTGAAISLIPGITNMSITAKSDLITLLMQLIFIYAVLRYIRRREPFLTGAGLGALLLSYAFKPTALIFSSAIGLAALIYLKIKRIRLRINLKGAAVSAFCLFFTAIMTLRTFMITGVPFTGIYTELFVKLGFTLKYPMRIIGGEGGSGLNISDYALRVIKFFFCPVGSDMEHVRMAWGGIAMILLLIAAILLIGRTAGNIDFIERLKSIRGDDGGRGLAGEGPALTGLIYTELILSLILTFISLYFLSQVDGNYFCLTYALSAITGTSAVYASAEAAYLRGAKKKRGSNFGVVFVAVVMIFLTAVTSWSGAVGFTPADFINKGYYDHELMYGLKNPLNWDKHTRVVAFMYEPECYKLRGRVESWVDIDGSGGNVYLTDTKLDIFKEYLSVAGIDYIYCDLQFINDTTNERRVRAGVLFRYLLEDGCFSSLTLDPTASNCIFCKIDKERAAVSWEEDMGKERAERTDRQIEWFDALY